LAKTVAIISFAIIAAVVGLKMKPRLWFS
jgi:hypothetical protein